MSLRKDELAGLLKYHDDLYYNQDAPVLSDAEYDELKKQYVELYGEYNYVPGEASKDSKKFTHSTPILSLDKVQITEEDKLRSEIERLWPVIIQPKMDGLTLVSYPGGIHVTRGNGLIGEIVSDNVKAGVKGIGEENHLTVRSEVVMLKSKFNELNAIRVANGEEPFKNPRNAAAGMLRQKDASKVEGLTAFAYNIISQDERNNSYPQILALQNYGWNTVITYSPETVDDAIEYIKSFDREELDYEIDGLVIKYDGTKTFGTTGHHPKSAIAVKFAAEGVWTTLKSVTWQVGKTGAISPVAEIEPIEILGSTINRVTLHNIGIINAIGVRINGQVKVIKANDVIPRIIKAKGGMLRNDFPVIAPKKCPVCGSITEFKKDILFCTGDNCEAQLQGKIELLSSRDALNIEGLSEMTIEKMIAYVKKNHFETYKPLDFTLPYYMTYNDILKLDGFAPVSAKKLYDNIQKSKDTELKRFIYASCIPLIGRSASEDIANRLRTIEALIEDVDNNYLEISTINDFGPKMINSLQMYGREHFGMLWEAGIRPRPVKKLIKKVDTQLTIVITGAFDIPRKEIETMIKDAGHKTSGSVSKKTSYLLASPGEESTSKYKKAKELNIPIINNLEKLKVIIK